MPLKLFKRASLYLLQVVRPPPLATDRRRSSAFEIVINDWRGSKEADAAQQTGQCSGERRKKKSKFVTRCDATALDLKCDARNNTSESAIWQDVRNTLTSR